MLEREFLNDVQSMIGLPSKGTASLVAGIVSATICEKTVRDRSIVTPERGTKHLQSIEQQLWSLLHVRLLCILDRVRIKKNKQT